jgi:hypothetical protein
MYRLREYLFGKSDGPKTCSPEKQARLKRVAERKRQAELRAANRKKAKKKENEEMEARQEYIYGSGYREFWD